jgi:hypothetical protein
MSVRYERNHGFELELERDPRMVAHIRSSTTTVAVAVRAAAPRKTGRYRKSVKPRDNRVVAEDPFWHLVEYGSVNNPPYAPLRRGTRAAGLRLDESRI